MINNTVIVLCNGVLYGTWLLPDNLSITQENDLRFAISQKVKTIGVKDYFTVVFDAILRPDSVTELTDGILESIENSYP